MMGRTRIGFDEARRRILAGASLLSMRRQGVAAQGGQQFTVGGDFVMESTADKLQVELRLVVVRRSIGISMAWALPAQERANRLNNKGKDDG